MIIDGFTFFNEYDLLDLRLKILYDYVDLFVITEGNRTFAGNKKPFNYKMFKGRYDWAKDKILYQTVDLPEKGASWNREYQQRNAIISSLNECADDDILIMGDVDELVSREAVIWAKSNVDKLPMVCHQAFFYYNLHSLRQEIDPNSIISTLAEARRILPQGLRGKRGILPPIPVKSGWHCSYFGGETNIREKIQSFSHQELNIPRYISNEHIGRCIRDNKDLFDRGTKFTTVDESFFPQYFVDLARECNVGKF